MLNVRLPCTSTLYLKAVRAGYEGEYGREGLDEGGGLEEMRRIMVLRKGE